MVMKCKYVCMYVCNILCEYLVVLQSSQPAVEQNREILGIRRVCG